MTILNLPKLGVYKRQNIANAVAKYRRKLITKIDE